MVLSQSFGILWIKSMGLLYFFIDITRACLRGRLLYSCWLLSLFVFMSIGLSAYLHQLKEGLVVTGMNDHVSWGLYISNFTFLVGIAAAAVMLVLPTYVLDQVDFSKAVLMGEGVAVSALVMCLAFVTVDLGHPERAWHLIPFIGYFNFPSSMLAWDVLVLNGYLLLNFCIPCYILYCKYRGRQPDKKKYVPFVYLSVFWAVGIHMVTAFLYAGLPARPFWNNALLGPRFLASAFAAGPAFIIIVLAVIRKFSDYEVRDIIFKKLAMITTVAAQINLIMLGSEVFKEFYASTAHSHSATYLFFGLHGKNALVPWIWTSIGLNLFATIALTYHKLRRNKYTLYFLCIVIFIAIWIEKGMGLIVPGFIPLSIINCIYINSYIMLRCPKNSSYQIVSTKLIS